MVLTLIPACRSCNDRGWYRLPNPAGRGEVKECEKCQPKKAILPMTQSPEFLAGVRAGLEACAAMADIALSLSVLKPYDSQIDCAVIEGARFACSAIAAAIRNRSEP